MSKLRDWVDWSVQVWQVCKCVEDLASAVLPLSLLIAVMERVPPPCT